LSRSNVLAVNGHVGAAIAAVAAVVVAAAVAVAVAEAAITEVGSRR
jgi:hypothetical protein